jgi:hemoglobin-like flavoprotein
MTDYAAVTRSFERCLRGGDVVQRFYDLFIAADPEIAPWFARTDFPAQKRLLEQSINLAILFAAGNPIGRIGIERIRDSHAPGRMDIPPRLYAFWKLAFLRAVEEFDPSLDPDLAAAWDAVLQATVDHVLSGREGA